MKELNDNIKSLQKDLSEKEKSLESSESRNIILQKHHNQLLNIFEILKNKMPEIILRSENVNLNEILSTY